MLGILIHYARKCVEACCSKIVLFHDTAARGLDFVFSSRLKSGRSHEVAKENLQVTRPLWN